MTKKKTQSEIIASYFADLPTIASRIKQRGFEVDPKFHALLPVLTPIEYASLEQDIIDNGCRDALILGKFMEDGRNKVFLIDGHNRLIICEQHKISYKIAEPIEFESRDDVISWIVANQKNRRNMTKFRWIELALNYEKELAEKAKENQRVGEKGLSNSNNRVHTLEKLGEIANAGTETVFRVKYILKNASEDEKNRLRMGYAGISINSVYSGLLNKEANTKKITLGSEEKHEKLKEIFAVKLNGILADIEEFKLTLEDKEIKEVNSLTKAIIKLMNRI